MFCTLLLVASPVKLTRVSTTGAYTIAVVMFSYEYG